MPLSFFDVCVESFREKIKSDIQVCSDGVFDMSGNDNLGREGVRVILEELPNTSIHTLDLSSSNINGAYGLIYLAKMLKNTNIRTLLLSDIRKTDDEPTDRLLDCLSEIIKQSPAITNLDLSIFNWALGDNFESMERFATSIHESSIQTLRFDFTVFGIEEFRILADKLPGSQVRHLSVRMCGSYSADGEVTSFDLLSDLVVKLKGTLIQSINLKSYDSLTRDEINFLIESLSGTRIIQCDWVDDINDRENIEKLQSILTDNRERRRSEREMELGTMITLGQAAVNSSTLNRLTPDAMSIICSFFPSYRLPPGYRVQDKEINARMGIVHKAAQLSRAKSQNNHRADDDKVCQHPTEQHESFSFS